MAHPELAELIRNTGRLEPAQAKAWEQWTGFLPPESRQALSEVQSILSGIAAFAQIENRVPDEVRTDFHPHVIALQEACHAALLRARYLRRQGASQQRLRAAQEGQAYQIVPEDALGILERTLSDALRVLDPFCRSANVDTEAFRAGCDLITRDLERNPFMAPLGSFEFSAFPLTPEEDARLSAFRQCTSESARAVTFIATLCLLRMIRNVELARSLHEDAATRHATHVLWAALRRDARHLAQFLTDQAAKALEEGLSAQVLSIPESLVQKYEHHASERIDELRTLSTNIESIARTFEQQVEDALSLVPSIDSTMLTQARLFPMVTDAVEQALVSFSQVVESIQKAWQAEVAAADVERVRLHAWMVQHVIRAFIAKASAVTFDSSQLSESTDLRFIGDFMKHFRALGRPVVEEVDYDRKRELVAALKRLREAESMELPTLNDVAAECSLYSKHLELALRIMCARKDVPPFDRAAAARRFRRYLASTSSQAPEPLAQEPKTHRATQ